MLQVWLVYGSAAKQEIYKSVVILKLFLNLHKHLQQKHCLQIFLMGRYYKKDTSEVMCVLALSQISQHVVFDYNHREKARSCICVCVWKQCSEFVSHHLLISSSCKTFYFPYNTCIQSHYWHSHTHIYTKIPTSTPTHTHLPFSSTLPHIPECLPYRFPW